MENLDLEKITQTLRDLAGLLGFDLVEKLPPVADEPACATCTVDDKKLPSSDAIKENVQVTIASLGKSPSVEFKVGQKNTIMVEDFDHLPGTCGTAKVNLLGRTIFTNVCEDEHGASIALDIMIENKLQRAVKFYLTKDKGNSISEHFIP